MAYIHLTSNRKNEELCKGNKVYYLSNPDKGSCNYQRDFVLLDLNSSKNNSSSLKDAIFRTEPIKK